MGSAGIGLRLVAMAAVTLVGAGACAFGSQREDAGASRPAAAGVEATGASATPGTGQGPTTPPSPAPPTRPPTAPPAPPAPKPKPKTCRQGEHQRAVETYLARLGGYGPVTVDGTQSDADCKAIKKFQQRYGIEPAGGRAGPTTYDVARRIAGTDTKACGAGKATTVCINLTLQTVWVMQNGRVALGPTVTRTGMSGFATPTGHYTIQNRNIKEWSDPYEVWMPYWQRVTGGIGLHQTTTYIHNKGIGSHGCINLLPVDARHLWKLGRVGTKVHIFGHRPGT